MKTFKFYDSRVTRNTDAAHCLQLCNDIVKSLDIQKEFAAGWSMTRDYFFSSAYKQTWDDVQVDITLDFKLGRVIVALL